MKTRWHDAVTAVMPPEGSPGPGAAGKFGGVL